MGNYFPILLFGGPASGYGISDKDEGHSPAEQSPGPLGVQDVTSGSVTIADASSSHQHFLDSVEILKGPLLAHKIPKISYPASDRRVGLLVEVHQMSLQGSGAQQADPHVGGSGEVL